MRRRTSWEKTHRLISPVASFYNLQPILTPCPDRTVNCPCLYGGIFFMYTDSAHIPLTCSKEKEDPPYSLCLCMGWFLRWLVSFDDRTHSRECYVWINPFIGHTITFWHLKIVRVACHNSRWLLYLPGWFDGVWRAGECFRRFESHSPERCWWPKVRSFSSINSSNASQMICWWLIRIIPWPITITTSSSSITITCIYSISILASSRAECAILSCWTLFRWTAKDIATPIIVLRGWWPEKRTRRLQLVSTHIPIHRSLPINSVNRSSPSRKSNWPTTKWTNKDRYYYNVLWNCNHFMSSHLIGFNRNKNNSMVSKIPRIIFKFWCTVRSAET